MPSIALALVVGILTGSILVWRTAIARWRSGQPLLPAAPRPAAPWGVVDLGMAIFLYLAGNFAAMLAAHAALKLPAESALDQLDPTHQKVVLVITGIATLAACAIIVVALRARHRVTPRELGWDARYLFRDIALGCKAFLMLAPIVYAIQFALTQLVESKHPLIEVLKKNPDPAFFAAAGFVAVIVAPVAEEFLFRVLLQGWLERLFSKSRETTEQIVFGGRPNANHHVLEAMPGSTVKSAIQPDTLDADMKNPYRPPLEMLPSEEATSATDATLASEQSNRPARWSAIAMSSLFFALSHWSHGPDPIPLFVFAMGLGYLFDRTHRILPSIVLHFLLNGCSLLALGLSVMQ